MRWLLLAGLGVATAAPRPAACNHCLGLEQCAGTGPWIGQCLAYETESVCDSHPGNIFVWCGGYPLPLPPTTCDQPLDCMGATDESAPTIRKCDFKGETYLCNRCVGNPQCVNNTCTCNADLQAEPPNPYAHAHTELQFTHAHVYRDPLHTHSTTQDFASDDMPLVLGIAIGVPLGAAYLAVHNRVLAV